jgi:hydroxymethylpyrimidine/phosphomethylpyrimidine kinase
LSLSVVLSIAGSDSGGGAGIQADLKTFHAFGTFGTTAVTAITAQNTLGVSAIHAVPSDVVREQIEAVALDLKPAAVKTGMLATRELVRLVASGLREFELPNYVLDPVMVATSGDRLLDSGAERSIAEKLVPLSAIVTPNLDEATILVGFPVEDAEGMRRAAGALVEMGAGSALLKGGHLRSDQIVDILFDGTDWHEWTRTKRQTTSTHGTGCTLSAGIAAGLARGWPLTVAVERSLDYLQRALANAPRLGAGNGPLNHMVEVDLSEAPA